jgi:hypothetical protein
MKAAPLAGFARLRGPVKPVSTAALFAVLLGCGTSSSANPQEAGVDVESHDAAKPEAGADSGPPRRIGCVDRAGRPAMIFAVFPAAGFPSASGDAGSNRNAYNCTDAFSLTGGGPIDVSLEKDFAAMLSKLDELDGKRDWPTPSPLSAPLTTDALLMDPSKPFSTTSYLDIEYATFAFNPPGSYVSCGGRWPGEDAIDKTLSIFVKKALTGVSGRVSAPTAPPTMTFPYLAAPN